MSFKKKKRSFPPRMLFGGGGERDFFFPFFPPLPDGKTCWGGGKCDTITRVE